MAFIVISLPLEFRLPRPNWNSHENFLPELQSPRALLAASATSSRRFFARRCFRRCSHVPGTTRWHANEKLTALPDFRPARSCSRSNRTGSYLQHSPRHRLLNHLADMSEIRRSVADHATDDEIPDARHRITNPAAEVFPRLVMIFVRNGHVAYPVLPGSLLSFALGSRPGKVCTPRCVISGGRR